jgi:hypothetical protein
MAQSEALRALADIRSVIDRTARYSTFSALSGFLAGGAALIGSGCCGYFADFPGARSNPSFFPVWAGVFGFAAVQYLCLTWLKARRRGEPVWTPIARTAFNALLGPGAAGIFGSLVLFKAGNFEFLAGLWLLLYGCGLWSVSFFAPIFLRWLGAAFICLGCAAWYTRESPGLWLGLGFGCLHFVFGIIVLARYQK